jgi:hypothetical protein
MQQPMAQQISQPLAVLYIGFVPRQRFDVLGVDQQQRAPLTPRTLKIGRQSTPVLSIATWVT